MVVHGLRPGAHCRIRDGRMGHRPKADDPEHGFRQFRWSEESSPDYGIHPACCQEREWKTVVLASRRRQRHRSASPALQQASAAGADRASYRGPKNLLAEFVWTCIHVAASNNSGVWNEAGTFLDFSVAPAYYQTNWFRLSAATAIAILLWCMYRLRVHSIQQRSEQLALVNAKLEAQIAERRQAEEALRQAQADLTYASRVSSMGELTASLAHEIKQPIAAAITNANTCLRWLSRDQPDL